jgi:hypothetical protein
MADQSDTTTATADPSGNSVRRRRGGHETLLDALDLLVVAALRSANHGHFANRVTNSANQGRAEQAAGGASGPLSLPAVIEA